jgi:SAM-dependent methyltransferase
MPQPRRDRGDFFIDTASPDLGSYCRLESSLMSASSKKRERRLKGMAARADRHELYEASVQDVESEVDFMRETYESLRGKPAKRFREDFCGTASACCEWVRRDAANIAVGVDLDQPTLDWGYEHRVARLSREQQARVMLRNANVVDVETPEVDIVGAFNFSYYTFQTRDALRAYFQNVHRTLAPDGLFILDAFGGQEAMAEMKEKTKLDDFTYVWHQATYHPVTGFMRCHIHFRFPDGTKIKRAFTYEWRLWTLPEIRELLAEAGFRNVTVYWEGTDEDGEGDGTFSPSAEGEADLAWIAYIVAER